MAPSARRECLSLQPDLASSLQGDGRLVRMLLPHRIRLPQARPSLCSVLKRRLKAKRV